MSFFAETVHRRRVGRRYRNAWSDIWFIRGRVRKQNYILELQGLSYINLVPRYGWILAWYYVNWPQGNYISSYHCRYSSPRNRLERVTIGVHRWCIVTVKEDLKVYTNVLITKDIFNEDEEFNIRVGLTIAVIVYSGLDSNGLETCTILSFDETAPSE